jgi:hypothetical protein
MQYRAKRPQWQYPIESLPQVKEADARKLISPDRGVDAIAFDSDPIHKERGIERNIG